MIYELKPNVIRKISDIQLVPPPQEKKNKNLVRCIIIIIIIISVVLALRRTVLPAKHRVRDGVYSK